MRPKKYNIDRFHDAFIHLTPCKTLDVLCEIMKRDDNHQANKIIISTMNKIHRMNCELYRPLSLEQRNFYREVFTSKVGKSICKSIFALDNLLIHKSQSQMKSYFLHLCNIYFKTYIYK